MAGGRSQVVLEFIGDDSRLNKTLKNVESKTSSVLGVIGKLGKVSGGASAFLGMANAGQTLVGTLSLIAPVALALPGILGGVMVATQTAKLAFMGFGDAVKGDAEALAKFGVEGQAAAKSVKALEPEFDKMRKAVSEGMFKGLAPEIQATGKHLLKLGQENLPLVSAAFNGMGKDALQAARTPFFTGGLQNIMGGTIDGLTQMRYTLSNVILGFVGLGSVGSIYLPAIGNAIDNVARKFRNWVEAGIETGSIEGMINTAIDGFKQLWGLISAVGSVMKTLWTGLQAGLGSGVQPLTMLTEKVQAFNEALKSPEAQNALRMIGETIRGLSEAFNAVLPHLISFAAVIISAILPAVIAMAAVVRDNGALFAGLIIGIVGVVAAVKTLLGIVAIVRGAIMAWTAVQWLLNIAMSANPIGLIILAVMALIAVVALIITYWEPISGFFAGLWQSIVDTFQSNVAAVVAFAVGMWESIKAAFQAGIDWVISGINAFVEMNRTAWNNFKQIITSTVDSVLNFVREMPGKILGFFSNLPGMMADVGRNIVTGLWNGIKAMGAWLRDSILNWVRMTIPGPVLQFLGIASPSKYFRDEIGRHIPTGLAAGIEASTPAAVSAATNLAQQVAQAGNPLVAAFNRDLAAARASGKTIFEDNSWRGMDKRYTDDIRMGPRGGSAPSSGGGVQVTFVGNTSDALATVIMNLIRTGKIQLRAV